MTKRHGNIDQIDGIEDLEEDDKYLETCNYWKTGILGTVFQTFLDVNNIIDKSNISEESKTEEKAKAMDARKCAFWSNFHRVPPWNVRL